MVEDYPKTLMEFEERFRTEGACRDYVFRMRWPDGFVCPRCGQGKAWNESRSRLECCACGLRTSVLVDTIFQDSKKPLTMWLRAMWHITSQKYGANALGLQRILGLGSYHTAWNWLHKLRRAMVRPGRDRLSGIVEVDETYIGGERPGKRGRGAAGKVLVVIAAALDGTRIGRIRLTRVADASADSLCAAVVSAVDPGSLVRTDGWDGYAPLSRMGYGHEAVNLTATLDKTVLAKPHRIAALVKRWLAGTYQGAVRPFQLDYYLDEYTFRFNRRTSASRGKLFYRLMQQAVVLKPVLVRDIEGGSPVP